MPPLSSRPTLLAAPPKPICCCSMEAIAELEDPQVGLKLLRSCAAHTRMTHGLRGAPRPSNPRLARLRPQSPECFLTGLRLDHSRWDQAAHGLPQSGLGQRCCILPGLAWCLREPVRTPRPRLPTCSRRPPCSSSPQHVECPAPKPAAAGGGIVPPTRRI